MNSEYSDKKKFTKRVQLIILLVTGLSQLGFMTWYDQFLFNEGKELVDAHIDVVRSSIWSLDSEAPKAYLQLAANSKDYSSLVITNELNTTFIDISRTKISPVKRWLEKFSLVPTYTFTKNIEMEQRYLGKISIAAIRYDYVLNSALSLLIHVTVAIATYFLVLLNHSNRRLRQLLELIKNGNIELEKAKVDAEVANRTKSAFLASISHDLRTPLNAVLGFSEVLREGEKNVEKQYYLETIHTAGDSLLGLINNVLDLSKIEAGKLELEYRPVVIADFLAEISALFINEVEGKSVEFITELSASVPEELFLDHVHLRQIVVNLVGNAVKFTEKGSIQLVIDSIAVSKNTMDMVDLSIIVEDTGKGVPIEEQELIFEAFEQTSGQNLDKFGGSGLGLVIVKKLANAMGGDIYLESELDKGSKFTLSIPSVRVAYSTRKNIKERELDFDSIDFDEAKILVVDDISYNRELIIAYLDKYNFSIIEGENGLEAINLSIAEKPNVILLDMGMPILNGYEACIRLKNDVLTRDIPIIAVTASAFKHDEERIRKYCNDYLRKPLTKENLVNSLKKFINYTEKPLVKNDPKKEVEFSKVESLKNGLEIQQLSAPMEKDDKWFITMLDAISTSDIERITGLINEIERKYFITYSKLMQLLNKKDLAALRDAVESLKNKSEKNVMRPLKRVLVAEDNKVNQIVIERLLHKMGFDVELVENGQEAVNAVEAVLNNGEVLLEHFELILMDCDMPVLDGFLATKSIRELESSASSLNFIPIIALSAYSEKEIQAQMEKCGMNDYLSKPIDRKALTSKVNRYL